MSKRRTERLLSIVVLLLSTRRYLTAEQIRNAVHGYPEQEDAFKRMFERDKEELRDLGIPLETGLNNAIDEEPGYRISRQDYELPEIRLEADEAAVLGIAARVWQSAELAGAAAGALLKLRAAGAVEAAGAPGLDDDQQPRPGIEPRLTTAEPAFGPLWEAVRDRRPVSFSYKGQGRSDVTKRDLEPWGVVNWRGRWYVAGHDQTRNATRVFRLSRIDGPVKMSGPARSVTVPADADVRELVKNWDTPLPRDHEAVLRVRAGGGYGVRRYAKTVTPDGDGWDRITVQFADVPWYADHLASFGPDVMVIGPPDLREAVISRLKGVLA
ncbi:MAG TPA: WYL domain-containing protein [Trebonia sp.]|nr:WYL domain-containing protein [Trebonia sp.]